MPLFEETNSPKTCPLPVSNMYLVTGQKSTSCAPYLNICWTISSLRVFHRFSQDFSNNHPVGHLLSNAALLLIHKYWFWEYPPINFYVQISISLILWKPTYDICYHEWPKWKALVKLRFLEMQAMRTPSLEIVIEALQLASVSDSSGFWRCQIEMVYWKKGMN